jgi:hypothetical protein
VDCIQTTPNIQSHNNKRLPLFGSTSGQSTGDDTLTGNSKPHLAVLLSIETLAPTSSALCPPRTGKEQKPAISLALVLKKVLCSPGTGKEQKASDQPGTRPQESGDIYASLHGGAHEAG